MEPADQISEVARLKKQSPARKAAGMTSKYLHVSGIGPDILEKEESLRQFKNVFEEYGNLEDVDGLVICVEKRFCWVRYVDESCAIAAMNSLSGQPCAAINGRCLTLSYADAAVPPPMPATAIMPSDQHPSGAVVPGLEVMEDFISEEEERELMSGLCSEDSSAWQQGISRRVQHYGYTFSYETLGLIKADTLDFPVTFADIASRLQDYRAKRCNVLDGAAQMVNTDVPYFTQLTLNEYLPGQGISSHVDNIECFGDCIYILSLGGGITMLMSENNDPTRAGGRDLVDSRLAGFGMKDSAAAPKESDLADAAKETRHIWLPPRSLLILEKDSRFGWCHGIAPRKNDVLPDVGLVGRERRVSLTFRQATAADNQPLIPSSISAVPSAFTTVAAGDAGGQGSDAKVAEKQSRVEEMKMNIEKKKEKKKLAAEERSRVRAAELKGIVQPDRKKVPSSIPLSEQATKDIETGKQVPVGLEQTNVFDVYDQIALHWHHTRGIRKVYWHRVKDFLDSLPKGSLIADVGSGDGKYFGVNPGIVSIGCDRSEELLKVSWTTEFETLCCDAVKLPYRDNVFDSAICIAVMHHLATVTRRLSLLSEMLRIVTPGGFLVIQAWAQEQGEKSKRTFESQDVLVPWQLQDTFTKSKEEGNSAPIEKEKTGGNENNCEALVNTTPGNNTTKIFQRYCHVYKEGELEELCAQLPECQVVETGWDKGNWFVKLRKKVELEEEVL